jgi:hypothetical protein
MYCARKGSPGISTVAAKSPRAAFICLVVIEKRHFFMFAAV